MEEHTNEGLLDKSIFFKRVPKKTRAWFKEYANEEFEGDYGMTLKHIVDFYRGMYTETMLSGIDISHQKLDKIIEILEPTLEKESSQVIKMASGREIKK